MNSNEIHNGWGAYHNKKKEIETLKKQLQKGLDKAEIPFNIDKKIGEGTEAIRNALN